MHHFSFHAQAGIVGGIEVNRWKLRREIWVVRVLFHGQSAPYFRRRSSLCLEVES